MSQILLGLKNGFRTATRVSGGYVYDPKEALSNFKIGVYDPPTSRYQDAKDKRL